MTTGFKTLAILSSVLVGTLTAHQDIDVQVAALTADIAIHPDDPTLYHRRADLNRAHQEYDLALADYDRALALEPALAGSHVGRSSTLLATGKPQQALNSADHATSLQPKSPDAHLARARALATLGQSDAADKAYTQSLSLHQRLSPDLFTEHAAALQNQTPPNLPRAIEILTAGIATIGPIVTLVSPVIDLHLQSGNPTAALALFDQLPPSLLNTPNWIFRRAQILTALGQIPQAHQTYRAAHQAIARLPARRRNTAAMTALLAEIKTAIAGLK